jgi:hypothetical protein
MEVCKRCGSERDVCKECGELLHKRLDDFIVRSEIIYAISMAWGFAACAESVIRSKTWALAPLLIIAGFVLMRFFFAPTKNLYSAALTTEHRPGWRWLVFLFDFPLLLAHSFAYYTMCLSLSTHPENSGRFFQWVVVLLAANVVWLVSIALRMLLLNRKKYFTTFIKWTINNCIAVIFLAVAFYMFSGVNIFSWGTLFSKGDSLIIIPETTEFWVCFGIAFVNCCVDLILTASDYLGFSKL